MITKFQTGKSLLLLLLTGLFLSACHTHSDDTTPVSTGTLGLHIHTAVDTSEVEAYGEEYTLTGGRKVTVNKAQLYISDMEAVKLDGSVYAFPNQLLLTRQGMEEYTVGDLPTGNYKTIRFKVGLRAAVNQKVPSATDSLLNHSEMWFNTSAQPDGYVYINFQGSIDTTAAANGSVLTPFTLKIGTDTHLKTVTMPEKAFSVSKGNMQYLHLEIDFAKLFEGVKLSDNTNLNVADKESNDWVWVAAMSNNIATMFSYEE